LLDSVTAVFQVILRMLHIAKVKITFNIVYLKVDVKLL